MRWFEQVTSKPRCSITQFHRPAELKLETVAFFYKMAFFSVQPLELVRIFLCKKEVRLWTQVIQTIITPSSGQTNQTVLWNRWA